MRDREALGRFLREAAADAERRRAAEAEEERERMRREARPADTHGQPLASTLAAAPWSTRELSIQAALRRAAVPAFVR